MLARGGVTPKVLRAGLAGLPVGAARPAGQAGAARAVARVDAAAGPGHQQTSRIIRKQAPAAAGRQEGLCDRVAEAVQPDERAAAAARRFACGAPAADTSPGAAAALALCVTLS